MRIVIAVHTVWKIRTQIYGSPTALYRFYDTRGVLLYVGITRNAWKRFAIHESSEWARDVDPTRTRIRWYRTRRAAIAAETRAIRQERPVYNLHQNTHPTHPPVQASLPIRGWLDDPIGRQHWRSWLHMRLRVLSTLGTPSAWRGRGTRIALPDNMENR